MATAGARPAASAALEAACSRALATPKNGKSSWCAPTESPQADEMWKARVSKCQHPCQFARSSGLTRWQQ
eukprot:4196804-Amphidinium_carterae.1